MEIVLMNDNAIIPTRASKESAGLDLCSSIDVDIEVGSIKKVNTGICISLPENSYGSIRDKSSLASKGLLTLKKFKFLKDTERNNKGFGEMDEITFSKGFSDEVFEYFGMYNY